MNVDPVCEGVFRFSFYPRDAINVYLLGDIVVDAGDRFVERQLLSALSEFKISGHVLTHGHFDHQGCSRAVCNRFHIPLMCGEGDRLAVETGNLSLLLPKRSWWHVKLSSWLSGPGHPVSRSLREGDEVGGFVVIEARGHTPGHLAFWRSTDRVLVLGDVLFHRNPATLHKGLREPFVFATFDPEMNRRTIQKLAALGPKIVCFGHGEPLRDMKRLSEFVSGLKE